MAPPPTSDGIGAGRTPDHRDQPHGTVPGKAQESSLHANTKDHTKMRSLIMKTTATSVGCTLLLALGACTGSARFSTAPGAVRGQDVQPGQDQQVEMTPEQAAAAVNAGNAGMVGGNAEVAGKPDMSQQGATPQGVGYSNNPGMLYNPAMGQHTYIHHVIHHVHHDAASAAAAGLGNGAPPSGYQQGQYVVPNNENPDMRQFTGMPAYNLAPQHVYHAGVNVTHHHYYGAAPAGSAIGHWNPYANDGAGSVEGFTD